MAHKDVGVLTEGLLSNSDSPFKDKILHERSAIERGYDSRRRKSESEIEKERGAKLAPAQVFTRRWHPDFVDKLAAYRKLRPSEPNERLVSEIVRAIKPETLAQLVMVRAMSAVMKYPDGASIQAIGSKIGQDIRAAVHIGPIEKALREVAKATPCECSKCTGNKQAKTACQKFKRVRGVRRLLGDKETHRIIKVCREKPQHLPDEVLFLNNRLYRTVGIKMVHMFADIAKIEHKDENGNRIDRQAFIVDTVTLPTKTGQGIRRPLCIIPTKGLVKKLAGEIDRWRYRRPHYPFTVGPPEAWADPNAGGYIVIRKGIIANGTREQYDALEGVDLTKVYAGYNALGAVPYQNTPQLQSLIESISEGKIPGLLKGRFNKRGRWVSGIDNVPPSDDAPDLEHPIIAGDAGEIRAYHGTPEGAAWRESVEGKKWRHLFRKRRDSIEELHSLRELWHLQLDAMKRAGEHDRIYFVHDGCFRTRAKPQELYFSYHGPDVMRGLLRFANPGVLDDRARYWIRVNLANKWGNGWDKKPMDEREKFADEYRDMIREVAADPLSCLEWTKAEEQIQFVSACIAMHDDEHAKRIPIWQDATANGLQHFSAAGRDPVGASMCNLVDGRERMNPHKICADATKKLLEADGSPLALKIAKVIDAKLVKTPVTATPYGVTVLGMRDQLCDGFKEKGWMDDEAYEGANLLCKFVAKAMKEVAPAAIGLMDWIRSCARAVCEPSDRHPLGRPFCFYSPNGFPVVQPYRLETAQRVRVDGHSYYIGRKDSQCPINIERQVNGSAPNTVHAWDASHGSMTVARGHAEGVDMGLIYDCLGTVPSNVDYARQIFKEEFVALHSRDLVAELHENLSATYPDVRIPEPPAKGDFDLDHVLDSTYMIC